MRLEFDLNNNVEMPEIILGKRNYDKLGSIVNIDNLTYDYNLMSADTINFTVYKELNYEKERLWEEIKDRRLVYLKEFNEWFQIDVVINDKNGVSKEVTATSLCEAELSQIYIKSTEINTEDDIARDDYKNPTIFYKPSNPSESLLHRLLKAVPNYTIKHVDATLWSIQRMFSIDGTTVYDALTGEIAEETGCLFLFDSTDRSISVYDLKTNCNHCGYRGDYTDICPECGSKDLNYGYGNDTTIFVDSETLAESISLSSKQDEVKNYIKVSGGDEIINAAISACNPTGTQYIYAFSDRDKEDMSGELRVKLEDYFKEYDRLTPDYQSIMAELYDTIDRQLQLESAMMPDIETAETNAEKELAKLTAANMNPVAVQDVSIASVYTVNNAVLGMAKCIVNSTVYRIELIEDSTSFVSQTWKGKFRLTNYSDENDTAENTGYVTLTINDDYACQIEQSIRKKIDRDDIYLVDIFDVKTELNVFKAELKKYCLNRLNSFESAYQSVIDIMIDNNCANNTIYGDIYHDLYLPYYNKLTAIQAEIKVRASELEAVDKKLCELEKAQGEITDYLNLENFLGKELWRELCSFRREDSFENSNYISDGLNSKELIEKAQELLDKARLDAVTASTLQLSLSAAMFNLLAIPEFKKLTGMFEGGNWIRIKLDDKIYRLRLIHYCIDFSRIQNIEVEFSDVTETYNGLNDAKSLMDSVKTMAASFSYVAHQAKQGAKGFTELDTIRNDGLNAALYNISSSINQEFVIDEHGITGRQWDDISGGYLPEQVKFSNNCLVYTDDYWKTAKAALGRIEFYNPVLRENVSRYGLISESIVSGILMGNDIVGGNVYSGNYSSDGASPAGTHIDLNSGDFSFAGGRLRYDSLGNVLEVSGRITATSGSIGGFTIGSSSIYNGTSSLTSTTAGIYLGTNGIRQYASSDAYTNITKGILTAKGANITGTISTDNITATGGTIGKWSIGKPSGYGLGQCLYTETEAGIIGLQSSKYANNVAFFVKDKEGNDITYIKNNGELYSQNANISGTINAEKGKIGGWNINNLALECNYIQSSTVKWNVGLKVPTKDDSMFIYTSYYDTNLGANLISSYWEVGSGGVDTLFTYNVYAVHISASSVTSTIRFEETIQFGSYGNYYVNSSGNGVFNNITTSSITNTGNLSIGDYIKCKGNIEVLTSNNASNVILHNNYDRKIYLRYDEQSRFYIVPHTSNGFDSQNCFYMDAYTGDCCARSFVNASSIRYKENIKTLSDDFIDNFSKIRPVSFDYKPNIGYKNQYGLIAEEMEKIYPYVVTHDRDGNCEAIDYSKLTVLLIKKIQAMDKEIQYLNETINKYTA